MTFTYPAAVAWDRVGKQAVKNATFQVYAMDDTGFVTPLPIMDAAGAALPGNILTSGSQGVFPEFRQATHATVRITDPARTYIWTVNAIMQDESVASFLDDPESASAAAVKSAVSVAISDPTSDISTALSATYAPLWKPNTAYLVGDKVQGPAGMVITARVSFTSGASYSPANWWVIHADTLFISAAELTGLTNVTPNLRAASDYCIANGIKRIQLPPGTFDYQSRWFLALGAAAGLEIVGHGEATVFRHTGGSDLAFIHALGIDGPKVALTADIPAGSRSADLPSSVASTLSKGDIVGFESTLYAFDVNDEAGMRGYASELRTVAAVNGTTVTFSGATIWPYNTSDAAVAWKMTPVNGIKLRDFVITSADPLLHKWKGIQIAKAKNVVISGVTFRDAGGGLFFYDVVGGKIADVKAERLPNYTNYFGYGVCVAGRSANILVDNLTGHGTRHVFTTLSDERAGVHWGGPRNVRVRNGEGEAFPGSYAVWDTHPHGYDITFENCNASGGVAGQGDSCGFQIRSIKTQIINGIARNMGAAGIRHHTMADNLDVIGGEYSGCQAFGISLNANGRVNGAWVHENGTSGIILDARASKARIMNTRIEDNAKISSGYGVHDQTVGAQSGNVIGPGNVIPKASNGQTISILSPKNDTVIVGNILKGYGVGNDGVGGTIGAGVVRDNTVDGIASASSTQADFCSTVGSNPAVAGLSAAASAVIGTANTGIVMPVRPHRSINLSVLEWFAGTTSAGNYDIAVLDSAGARLWSKGSTAWPTASATVTETVSPAVALTAGQTYYVVLAADNATATYKGLNVTSNLLKLITGAPHSRSVGSIFPIPANVTLGSTATGKLPVVLLREA